MVAFTMIEDYKVMFNNRIFECVDKGFKPNEKVDVVIRPEDINIVTKENGKITGLVTDVVFKGVHYEIIKSTFVSVAYY